ncbi:hypothetical protein DFH08DRAFT_1021991 [Mycena albidolilacea]|uniref:Uncharacterized protein n=1 Tax=Mycena albidolilacea TaxID=1033008 RepID=A0AAD6ZNA4_9AGAR|nr:hypothetical protein DFH08DRAFT_1021991 [Mycena albidolilacea]
MSTSFVLAHSLTEGVLELILYGVFVVLFSTVVYLFSTRGLISRKRPTFFIFLALHLINGICALFRAFIFLGGGFPAEVLYLTLSSPTALAHNSLVGVTTVITDSLMIHRLYTVWSYDRRVIIFPLLVLTGQIGSASIARTLTQKVLVIMVESAVLQTTMTVGVLVSFQIGLLVQAVLIPLQPVVFGISVLLIHLRAGLGWASDSGLAGSGWTENSLDLSRDSMRRGTCEYDLELGKVTSSF